MEIEQPEPELGEPEQLGTRAGEELEVLDREAGADGDVAFVVHQAAEVSCFVMP
ncbi:hypothetical protein ABZ897_20405 [Nonomuraea sp. NPDC046802]|uniref:hypothetical protein n=1 Tax=Nonomuraea sp. NPDC046802 TaxID=3154919 RepID=UPI0033E785E6